MACDCTSGLVRDLLKEELYKSFLVKMYSILKIRLCAGMSQLDQYAASLVAYLICAFKDMHCTFTHVSMPS